MNKYEKTLEDELDWNLLNQLHNVVLQLSNFTYHTKQICLTVEIGITGLLFNLTGNKLDVSVFIASLIIALSFWFLDSVAYYYQVKIRSGMTQIQEKIRARNKEKIIYSGDFKRIIEEERITRSQLRKFFDAFFNNSMWFYYLLVGIILILWYLFIAGFIF